MGASQSAAKQRSIENEGRRHGWRYGAPARRGKDARTAR
jgi:hypothetical protein